MTKFIPRWGRIEIEPIQEDSLLLSEDKKFIEKGRVIRLGYELNSEKNAYIPEIASFCEVGDIIYFDAYGVYQTPEVNGESHWVVRGMEFVIGKDGE